MKRIIMLFTLLGSNGLMAQSYFPSVVRSPETGFMQLQLDNPYIVSFVPDGAEWVPSMRYVSAKAPNINFPGTDITSSWEGGTWTDLDITTDSFVLDAQNRISTVFNKAVYNYPGFTDKRKTKFTFAYNANGELERMETYNAVNFNSNSYTKSGVTFYVYNNGKRTSDSSIFYYNGGSQTTISHYAYNGDKLHTITQLNGPDTARVTYYTFSGDLLTSTVSRELDATTDEWTTTYADTFEYNAQGLVSRRASQGYVFRNGVLSIEPIRNDLYTYTDDHQLKEEITRMWENGEWVYHTKTEIIYGTNNKPEVGYEYEYMVNDWSTAPRTKYLFSFQTGLKTISAIPSQVSVFPNPVKDHLTIQTGHPAAFVSVMDITGKTCYEGTINEGEQLDVSQWKNGVYYMRVTAGEQQYTQKVIVTH